MGEVQGGNPNFPADLNIHPSSVAASENSVLDTIDDVFGQAGQEHAISRYGIAGKVWEASYAMINYIHPPPNLQFEYNLFDWSPAAERSGYTVLELGSGSGLVASTIAKSLNRSSDYLVATDLPEVIPLLQINILSGHEGFQDFVTVAPLPWGSHKDAMHIAERVLGGQPHIPKLTHVICSDLVYFPELLAPLLRSLLHITSPPFAFPSSEDDHGPMICISYRVRSLSKETPFWQAFGLWFEFVPMLVRDTSLEDSEWLVYGSDFEDPTYLFLGRRRLESFEWTVPELDEDLLGGVGAQGTDSRKSDDAFESLLFMSLS